MQIRPFLPDDASRLIEILEACSIFNETEIGWARDILGSVVTARAQNEYTIAVAHQVNTITGWACFGPTTGNKGVFDLYWIAVDPLYRQRGIGTALLRFVEVGVRSAGGGTLLVETSSRPAFEPTVQFYLRRGYEQVSRLIHFGRTEADRLLFSRVVEKS
jgi:GNAT superfamily N-acetyltransferase